MITKNEKIIFMLSSVPFKVAREAWISRARIEAGRISDTKKMITEKGFVPVEVTADAVMTDDGREILRMYGSAYALRPEVHAERLRIGLEQARERKRETEQRTTPVDVNEAISDMTCPQMVGGKPCGGALNLKGVCPSCVTGRMGYKYRYTCESCGCDIVTREELR